MLIRMLTAESYTHVALLAWEDCGGLWVYEFVEGTGYQAMPASQWFERYKGREVFHGTAHEIVHAHPHQVIQAAKAYRDKGFSQRYGWLSLLKVWASQILNKRIPVRMKVCSTFIQEVWAAAGYDCMPRTADPGDIAMECGRLTRIVQGEP